MKRLTLVLFVNFTLSIFVFSTVSANIYLPVLIANENGYIPYVAPNTIHIENHQEIEVIHTDFKLVMGEVVNNSGKDVDLFTLQMNFYDKNGLFVKKEQDYDVLSVLLKQGEKICYQFITHKANIVDVTFETWEYPSNDSEFFISDFYTTNSTNSLDVIFTNNNSYHSDGFGRIALFDLDGNMFYCSKLNVKNKIPPGKSTIIKDITIWQNGVKSISTTHVYDSN